MAGLKSVKNVTAYLSAYSDIYLQCSDPGLYYNFQLVCDELDPERHVLHWIASGWCYAQLQKEEAGAHRMVSSEALASHDQDGRGCLLTGNHIEATRVRRALKYCKQRNMASFFFLDHWKLNIKQFYDSASGDLILPDAFLVSDQYAKNLIQELFSKKLHHTLVQDIHIVGSPKIEHSIRCINAMPDIEKKEFRLRNGLNKKIYLVLLEPVTYDFKISPEDTTCVGYTEYSLLEYFFEHYYDETVDVIIKPHPRHIPGDIEHFLQTNPMFKNKKFHLIHEVPLELLISVADHVFGSTTLGLIIALEAGKKITSLQMNRNAKGLSLSNKYLEDYVVV